MTYDHEEAAAWRKAGLESVATIWTDGPDSEAARAARGEGSVMCPDLVLLHSYAQEMERELAAFEEPRPVSDPSHTPAVRRVVAWEARGSLFSEPTGAYWAAAFDIVAMAWRRCPTSLRKATVDEWWSAHWPHERVGRLAACLRHRDEKAGWR